MKVVGTAGIEKVSALFFFSILGLEAFYVAFHLQAMVTMEFVHVHIINHAHYIFAYFCFITAAKGSLITHAKVNDKV